MNRNTNQFFLLEYTILSKRLSYLHERFLCLSGGVFNHFNIVNGVWGDKLLVVNTGCRELKVLITVIRSRVEGSCNLVLRLHEFRLLVIKFISNFAFLLGICQRVSSKHLMKPSLCFKELAPVLSEASASSLARVKASLRICI